MKVLHPQTGQWLEVENHTVASIVKELNLDGRWSFKVNGEIVNSGNLPTDKVLEIVEYSEENESVDEEVVSDNTETVQ